MSGDDLNRVLRAMNRRRPFRAFTIELYSGDRVPISHPEAITRAGELFIHRAPDRSQRIIAAAGVCQVIDHRPSGGPAS